MGSKAGEIWKLLVPVIPRGGEKKNKYSSYCCSSSTSTLNKTLNKSLNNTKSKGEMSRKSSESESEGEGGSTVPVDMRTLQGEIAAVGARVNYIDEQIENIKAALPELDCKIPYASLGMAMSSLSLQEMHILKRIHFQLLHFWEDLSRKQLEKLGFLSECLQVLEEQGARAKNKGGEKPTAAEESYKEFEQHVSEKVAADLRKNQELEMNLYLDRISGVPDLNKPMLLPQSPPERGPGRVASKKSASTYKLQSKRESLMIPSKMKIGALAAPTP